MNRLRLLAALTIVALLAACGGGADDEASKPGGTGEAKDGTESTTSGDPSGEDPGDTTPVPRLRLSRVREFEQPLAMAVRPSDGGIFVAEKTGRVRALTDGEVLLDVSDDVSDGSEQGLLGLVFSPDGKQLYVNYTDTKGDTRVVEFSATGKNPREVLKVDQPFANHNGGHLAYGPDGMLYVGLGDGGSGGDPQGNGQKLSTRLGKILRLDPRPSDGKPFTVPPDNPFVGKADADPLIWAYGLRNPWRFSFDRTTGDMWIADVGQGDWEEVSVIEAGQAGKNLGWNRLEGTHKFEGTAPTDALPPVHEYNHRDGACSVTGGYLYRGRAIAGLDGAYLFGDYCDGQLRILRRTGDKWKADRLGIEVPQLAAFGEAPNGELYVLSLDGAVSSIEAR